MSSKWSLDSEGLLTISGEGEMDDWEGGDYAPWAYYDYDIMSIVIPNDIKSVIISEGVTSIGASAFWGCHNLTEVTISSSVFSIGEGAFRGFFFLADENSYRKALFPNSSTLR